jgi:hypothetical protein
VVESGRVVAAYHMRVRTPTQLSPRERSLFEELAKLEEHRIKHRRTRPLTQARPRSVPQTDHQQAVLATFLHSQPIGQKALDRDLYVLLEPTRGGTSGGT